MFTMAITRVDTMKRKLILLALLVTLAPLLSSANDNLLELKSRRGDTSLMYDRAIWDFTEFNRLASLDPATISVVIHPASDIPTAVEYEAANAYASSLKTIFPNASFTTDRGAAVGADYFVSIEDGSGYSESEATRTVYGSRSTAVTCGSGVTGSITCRESGSTAVPVGSRSVKITDRYVEVNITLSRSIYHGFENPKLGPDGRKITWETPPVFQDSFTLYFDGGCENEAAAAALVAETLGSDILSEQAPKKVRFLSNSSSLNCHAE